ncbi:uncharacterized protein LOC112348864 [Selaginella moellendorffii]|uniref:uncharacterized protein LOC112348864 n=1 Tax=Selaginella moellendorffii TaxID=88036 RepID=UPI000D1D0F92|nr:uncharacterized protein LOC112348864 [Selaginella moellendorffii]|eukprot:XP_024537939.1 uncharacterized protein LOC112348864 [Selaginella moellendorffii]
MEFFDGARKVKLSNCHGKFLWADDDKRGVSQSRKSDSENAIWEVRRVMVGDGERIRLRSCYNCYLTGSRTPFLLGMTGKKVIQTNPTKSDDLCDWKPEEIVPNRLIALRTRDGSLLRGNGGTPPWRNSVTHDVPLVAGTLDVFWAVHVVE